MLQSPGLSLSKEGYITVLSSSGTASLAFIVK
jgi:hypothetical protein